MKFKTRNFFWLTPVILIVTFPVWRQYVANFLAPEGAFYNISESVSSSQPGRSFLMEEITFSQFVKGRKDWSIDAQKLTTKNDETDIYMEEIKVAIWNDDETFGKARSAIGITGEKAIYDKDRKTMILTDNVIVTTEEGYEMKTDQLEFVEKRRQLIATSGVRIEGSNLIVLGESINYDLDTEKLLIEGSVTAEIQ